MSESTYPLDEADIQGLVEQLYQQLAAAVKNSVEKDLADLQALSEQVEDQMKALEELVNQQEEQAEERKQVRKKKPQGNPVEEIAESGEDVVPYGGPSYGGSYWQTESTVLAYNELSELLAMLKRRGLAAAYS